PNCATSSRAALAEPVRAANALPMPVFRRVAAASSMSRGSGHDLLPYTATQPRHSISLVAIMVQRSLRTRTQLDRGHGACSPTLDAPASLWRRPEPPRRLEEAHRPAGNDRG